MASLSGSFQRPLSALAAVVFAAASSDFLPDRFSGKKSLEVNSPSAPSSSGQTDSLLSQISDPKHSIISFMSKVGTMVNLGTSPSADIMFSSLSRVAPPHTLIDLYHYAKLANPSKTYEFSPQIPYPSSDGLYRWHFPDPNADGMLGKLDCSSAKSQTVVVLLGWLGAKQKHLKRYAEWYTSRGFHVVTFTFPMSEIVSYKAGGKAEIDLELLAEHLADWVTEESGKSLVFHTFSNTGWLTYGVVLEKFQKHDPSVIGKIKGCIVDSAPVAAPDPQVWASGFSAAFLKKQSVATKRVQDHNIAERGAGVSVNSLEQPKTTVLEATLLNILEKFFDVVFKLATINRNEKNPAKLNLRFPRDYSGLLEQVFSLVTINDPFLALITQNFFFFFLVITGKICNRVCGHGQQSVDGELLATGNEFLTGGLGSVPGDGKGGVEMTASMQLIREFLD